MENGGEERRAVGEQEERARERRWRRAREMKAMGESRALPALTPDWLKLDEWVGEQVERIHDIWKMAGRPYEANNGVARSISIASGKKQPPAAIAEKQRQKELGWDVKDNVMDM